MKYLERIWLTIESKNLLTQIKHLEAHALPSANLLMQLNKYFLTNSKIVIEHLRITIIYFI